MSYVRILLKLFAILWHAELLDGKLVKTLQPASIESADSQLFGM